MFNFFAYISRMKYIARWSLMRNSFSENIQEHSHAVAVLAHALGVIRRDVLGLPCDPNACATAALYPHQILQPRHPRGLPSGGG